MKVTDVTSRAHDPRGSSHRHVVTPLLGRGEKREGEVPIQSLPTPPVARSRIGHGMWRVTRDRRIFTFKINRSLLWLFQS